MLVSIRIGNKSNGGNDTLTVLGLRVYGHLCFEVSKTEFEIGVS